MKITTWNVRGLSALDKKCLVKRAIQRISGDIILLQETKLNAKKISFFKSFSRLWDGDSQKANGSMGGLAVLWNPDKVSVCTISKQENWMHCNIRFLQEDLEFSLFNVYGPTKTEEKKRVWKEISEQIKLVDSEKVIVAGDFNAILNNEEKYGGLRMNARVMEDFRDFVIDNNLFDVIPKSGNFTWTNKRANFSRILERLDRIFTGTYWIKGQFELELSILPITLSDHFSVQMNCITLVAKVKGNFKFLSMWWRDINFEKTIEKWWVECADYRGTPSFCFVQKMKYLRNKIKIWNVESFKNIFLEKIRVEAELDRLNNLVIEKGMSIEEFKTENSLKAELAKILQQEEIFWRDKSRELWIKARDSNSKFFHASLKAKRKKTKSVIC
ncbi:uncharacterized protein LOC131859110 [Cryptomeria japonica]|uniref:uncharacterized protein LOC131859110 n=1 Tax=Cryptomeria japonica TaxID=3369 RepID=UPI0027D9E1BE|nr:uncharacterized protein LOC131859110 [Cryptomeria japonica]